MVAEPLSPSTESEGQDSIEKFGTAVVKSDRHSDGTFSESKFTAQSLSVIWFEGMFQRHGFACLE